MVSRLIWLAAIAVAICSYAAPAWGYSCSSAMETFVKPAEGSTAARNTHVWVMGWPSATEDVSLRTLSGDEVEVDTRTYGFGEGRGQGRLVEYIPKEPLDAGGRYQLVQAYDTTQQVTNFSVSAEVDDSPPQWDGIVAALATSRTGVSDRSNGQPVSALTVSQPRDDRTPNGQLLYFIWTAGKRSELDNAKPPQWITPNGDLESIGSTSCLPRRFPSPGPNERLFMRLQVVDWSGNRSAPHTTLVETRPVPAHTLREPGVLAQIEQPWPVQALVVGLLGLAFIVVALARGKRRTSVTLVLIGGLLMLGGVTIVARQRACVGGYLASCESATWLDGGLLMVLGRRLVNEASRRAYRGDESALALTVRASRAFERACIGQSSDGCREAAAMALRGVAGEFPPDPERARAFYASACGWGNGRACAEAAALATDDDDLAAARPRLLTACDEGHGRACTLAAESHALGLGGEAELKAAAALYRKGCKLGASEACRRFAHHLHAGMGVEARPDEAAGYVKRASEIVEADCKAGQFEACRFTAEMLHLMGHPYAAAEVSRPGAGNSPHTCARWQCGPCSNVKDGEKYERQHDALCHLGCAAACTTLIRRYGSESRRPLGDEPPRDRDKFDTYRMLACEAQLLCTVTRQGTDAKGR